MHDGVDPATTDGGQRLLEIGDLTSQVGQLRAAWSSKSSSALTAAVLPPCGVSAAVLQAEVESGPNPGKVREVADQVAQRLR